MKTNVVHLESAPRRRRTGRVPWWFVVPAAVVYLVVLVVPALRGARLSLTDWDGISPSFDFVGLDNFTEIWDDATARAAVGQTVLVAVAFTVLSNAIGMGLAVWVNGRFRISGLAKTLIFLPALLTPVITAFLWQYVLAPQGALNGALDGIGLGGLRHDWLGDPDYALWSVIVVLVWQFSGYAMIVYLAGLQSVPQEVLEAAAVDGAGSIRRFWSVTRPLLAPAITINVVLTIIVGLKTFDQILVMTSGGPGHATETLSTVIYKQAFQFGRFGYGAALAVVLSVFVAAVSLLVYGRLARRENS